MNGAPAPRGGGAVPAELLRRLQTYIAPWWDAKNELNRKTMLHPARLLDAGENAASGLFALTVPTGGGKNRFLAGVCAGPCGGAGENTRDLCDPVYLDH